MLIPEVFLSQWCDTYLLLVNLSLLYMYCVTLQESCYIFVLTNTLINFQHNDIIQYINHSLIMIVLKTQQLVLIHVTFKL